MSELLLSLQIAFAAFAGIWGAAIGYVVLKQIRDDKQKKKKVNYIPTCE
jgi:hypothetical protein